MILGHTYYGPLPKTHDSLYFRDADILDFMGTLGLARLFGAVQDSGPQTPLRKILVLGESFVTEMPTKLSTTASKIAASPLIEQMKRVISELKAATVQGRAF